MRFTPIPSGFLILSCHTPVDNGKCRFVVRREDGAWGDWRGLRIGIWNEDSRSMYWWDEEKDCWDEVSDRPRDIAWVYAVDIGREDAFRAVLEANNQLTGVE